MKILKCRKQFLLIGFIALAHIGFSQEVFDVLKYQFEIEVTDANDSIYGVSKIKAVLLQPASQIVLNLTAVKDNGKGMKATAVEGTGIKSFVHNGEDLQIIFSTNKNKGDTIECRVAYKGIPNDGLIISTTKYNKRGFFADNWPNRGHNWLPCHDVPWDKAQVIFSITAPQHYQVVANGLPLEETNLAGERKLTVWNEEVEIPTKVMVIGIADFAVQFAGYVDGCIPVHSWVYPENKEKGFYDYALTTEILSWFIKKVGPYGYKKLANVQSKTKFGGLENANTIFYNENSVTGNRDKEDLYTHEIAHQWFGNMVTEKDFSHLWLSEGFATYFTILHVEDKYGLEAANAKLLADRSTVKVFSNRSTNAIIDTTKNFMSLLNANSYQKGSWVLHMLRNKIGDEMFWKAIRAFYEKYAGKTANSADFMQVVEKVSGKNMETFFTQWLYKPGIPEVTVKYRLEAGSKKILIAVEQTGKNGLFQFPLEVAWQNHDGSKTTKTLQISKASEVFSYPVASTVSKLVLDPNVKLLFNGKVE